MVRNSYGLLSCVVIYLFKILYEMKMIIVIVFLVLYFIIFTVVTVTIILGLMSLLKIYFQAYNNVFTYCNLPWTKVYAKCEKCVPIVILTSPSFLNLYQKTSNLPRYYRKTA